MDLNRLGETIYRVNEILQELSGSIRGENQNNSYFRAWREREVNKVPTQRNSDKIP